MNERDAGKTHGATRIEKRFARKGRKIKVTWGWGGGEGK